MLEVSDSLRLPEDLLADKNRDLDYRCQDQGDKNGWQDGAEGHEDHREGRQLQVILPVVYDED